MSPSMSRLNSEYSVCSAAIGCTATARRIVSAEASDSPRWRTLPAATSSAMAPTVSSMGTSGIGAVQVVEVDVVEAEPGERAVDRAAHVLGAAVDLAHAGLDGTGAEDAELGGDDRVVAARRDGLPDDLLADVRAVDVGGVEHRDAEVESPVDRLRRVDGPRSRRTSG